MCVRLIDSGEKQSLHRANSSLILLDMLVEFIRFSCFCKWMSRMCDTSSRIWRISCWILESLSGNCLKLVRASKASSSRPSEDSHRGENGRKYTPTPKNKAGMIWIKKGRRQPHSPPRYRVPNVIQKAMTMPTTIESSSVLSTQSVKFIVQAIFGTLNHQVGPNCYIYGSNRHEILKPQIFLSDWSSKFGGLLIVQWTKVSGAAYP